MSKNNYSQNGLKTSIQQEADSAQVQMTDQDYSDAKDLKLSDSEQDQVDNQIKRSGQGKYTGFEKSFASDFKKSPYKQNSSDPFEFISKDPNRAYKQIDFNKFRQNGYRDARGWIPLTKQNTTKENFPAPDVEYGAHVQSDGFWHVGDRIWAFMPRSQYAQVRQMINLKTDTRTKAMTQRYREEGKKLGKGALTIEDESFGPGI